MPKTIVCSVGTSAAKGICSPAQLAAWVTDQDGIDAAARVIFSNFSNTRPEGNALRDSLSAEIHSLVRIGVTATDRVILLASETPDGQACAKSVAQYLERYYAGILVEIKPVKGIQVKDSLLFRQEGVVNFVRHCLQAIHDFGAENVILNPTGGFKALVPYTVLVGMLKQAPCRYIFEQSEQLLDLPPLPVAIDRAPFEKYRSLFARIERETDIPRAVWEQSVVFADRPLLEPMVEQIDDKVTISGVGLLFLDEIRKPSSLVPFLSREAWKECLDNLCRLDDCDPFRFLNRVASDANHFQQAEHINVGNGLRWLKPGRTTDRYLVSKEGWQMLVWRAIREDQIGPNYPTQIMINPENDRRRYAPFTRMEFSDDAC